MFSVAKDWNPKQQQLNTLLSHPASAEEAIQLCRQMHAELHAASLAGVKHSCQDDVTQNLPEAGFRFCPKSLHASIAWCFWHLTRIEDAVVNLLIGEESQVFDDEWRRRMGAAICDTGNAMSEAEMDHFNSTIVVPELLNYRLAVGRGTQICLQNLTRDDLKRKPTPPQLERLVDEGVVLTHPESTWLVDFWAKKTVAGLLMMPVTRHQMAHLNECLKIKARYLNGQGALAK